MDREKIRLLREKEAEVRTAISKKTQLYNEFSSRAETLLDRSVMAKYESDALNQLCATLWEEIILLQKDGEGIQQDLADLEITESVSTDVNIPDNIKRAYGL